MADGESDDADRSGDTPAPAGGTYTLLIALPEPAEIEVGALGPHRFDAAYYAYTGSALGAGGFSRVERHRELAAGDRDVRHWHVDSLLGHPTATIEGVWTTPGAGRECAIARGVASAVGSTTDGSGPVEPVPGFGASDCDCRSHLVAADRDALVTVLDERHVRRGTPHR